MASITYDYHGLKVAVSKLEGAIEAFQANTRTVQSTGDELVAENNAQGVKSTMAEFQEKQEAVIKIMNSALENSRAALAQARELHLANGGEE